MRNLKYVCLIVFGLFILSCDTGNLFQSNNNLVTGNEQHLSSVAPHAISKESRYSISFDKEVWTLQFYAADHPLYSLDPNIDITNGILNDYERTREVVAISYDGDLTLITEWLDFGGFDNTMPEYVYKKHSDLMPAREASYDPVVKSVMSDGKLTYYSQSGKVVSEASYDPAAFSLSQQELMQFLSANTNVPAKQEIIDTFTTQGISAEYLGNNLIKIEQDVFDDNDIVKQIGYINTHSGQVERMLDIDPAGRIAIETITLHGTKKGVILPHHHQTTYFAEINGKWQEKRRIIETRTYHHAQIN